MYRGLVDGGPLEGNPYSVMAWPWPVVTVCSGPRGRRVLPGRQACDPDETGCEYRWTWGMWLADDVATPVT